MRLILVRHGQTSSNVGSHLDTAEPGADLTDHGRLQAQMLVRTLAAEDVGALYASPLVRTQQTAAPLSQDRGLAVAIRPGVREIGAGTLEMSSAEADVKAYLRVVHGWAGGVLDALMPGGLEDGAATLARFDAVVAEAAAAVPTTTAVIVTHGAVLRVWVTARARNATVHEVVTRPVHNTTAVVLEGEAGEWELADWLDPQQP